MQTTDDASRYSRRQSLGRVAIIDRSLPNDLIERLWRDPASLIAGGEMMRRTGLRRTVRLDWNSKSYVLKQYRPTWWHFVRQLPLRSWASATFRTTIKLIDAGFPTPRPVACVENRWGIFRRDSFLMYEYVEGVTLRSYLAASGRNLRPLTDDLSRQIRKIWQRLVELRVSLDDTHMGNIIIEPAGRLWVIDLDKTRFHRTNFMAARQQERGWQKFKRCAAKDGVPDVSHIRAQRAA
jgi:Lipopolysaccharide kinase (Kdo/WaaP) family